jgi:hypothetical protein
LSRRVIALVAAYVIALSGLISSFGATQVAAEAAAQPGAVLCHSSVADQSAPIPDGTNGKICIDSCCVGCLSLTAALPPPVTAVDVPPSCSRQVATLTSLVLVLAADTYSHRSRAPPTAA